MKHKNYGFTIVELLVAIVVVAILIAISTVAFRGLRERARLSAAASFDSSLFNQFGAEATAVYNFENLGAIGANPVGFVEQSISENAAPAQVTGGGETPILVTEGIHGGKALLFHGGPYGARARLVSEVVGEQRDSGMVSAWIKTSHVTQSAMFVAGRMYAYGITVASGGVAGVHGAASGSVSGTTIVNDGKWHHIAISYKRDVPNGSKLYVDGSLEATYTHNHSSNIYGGHTIGAMSQNNNQFIGVIDDVRFYSRPID